MGQWIDQLGQEIAAAAKSSRIKYEIGKTTAAPSGGWVEADLAGQKLPVKVPGHFRKELAAGMDVRVSVQDTVRVIDAILSSLPAPAVSSAPSNASSNSASTWTNASVSSGAPTGSTLETVAAYTRGLAGDVNELRDDVQTNEDALVSLKASYNDLKDKYNDLKNTVVAEVVTLLRDQGSAS